MSTNTIRVCDLAGEQLDHWVAKAEGLNIEHDPFGFGYASSEGGYWIVTAASAYQKIGGGYSPSTNWEQGGVIIERAGITLLAPITPTWPEWRALIDDGKGASAFKERAGSTALIAAMRCYVVSKFGDEVSA